jgi:hypothetical protein
MGFFAIISACEISMAEMASFFVEKNRQTLAVRRETFRVKIVIGLIQ